MLENLIKWRNLFDGQSMKETFNLTQEWKRMMFHKKNYIEASKLIDKHTFYNFSNLISVIFFFR